MGLLFLLGPQDQQHIGCPEIAPGEEVHQAKKGLIQKVQRGRLAFQSGDAVAFIKACEQCFHALGIDHKKEYHTPTGRPVMLVREGSVLPGLF